MGNKERITVIGGGNGGFAAASDLTLRGHEVVLFEHPEFRDSILEIESKGGIDLETLPSSGLEGGFARLAGITCDIERALGHADMVFVIAPAFAFENLAKACGPYVRDGQVFVLCPGNPGGSLFFRNTLEAGGCDKKIWVGELECLMYACRKKDASSVWIRGYKKNLGCGFFPDQDSQGIFDRLRAIYPNLIPRGNALETGLCNPNMLVHVPTMAFSAADIDNKEDRLFYVQCLSESVGHVIDRMDAERMQLNEIPGFHLPTLKDVIQGWYAYQGAEGGSVYEIQSKNPIFRWSKMPTSLAGHRYISEDVPFGLIPLELLLEQMGLQHPTITSMARICCALTGIDYYEQARTPDRIGIGNMGPEQLHEYLTTGRKS